MSWLCKIIRFSIPHHPLTNFEIQKYYQDEPRFNSAFSRNNLPAKIKDGAYVINFDEYADVGTHWIALFCNKNKIVYFDVRIIDSLVLNMFLKRLKNSFGIKT